MNIGNSYLVIDNFKGQIKILHEVNKYFCEINMYKLYVHIYLYIMKQLSINSLQDDVTVNTRSFIFGCY